MRLRAAHFACVLLLLSSLGAAEASELRSQSLGLGGQYVAALLQHGAAIADAEAASGDGTYNVQAKDLQPESLAVYRAVWMMRAPVAQSSAIQALTAEGSTRL